MYCQPTLFLIYKRRMMERNPIKTAIVGYGLAGHYMHAPFLLTQPKYYDVISILERHKKESNGTFS